MPDRKSASLPHVLRVMCLALLLLPLLSGCGRKILSTRYFLLEYQPSKSAAELTLPAPLGYRVLVSNFKIPRSYDSIRIIARYTTHQIDYYRYSLWAVRPQIAIADLMAQHINAYQLFRDCQREFLEDRPDYEITGEIQQVERYESEEFTAAHLKATLVLYDYNTNERLVVYGFDREIPIAGGQMEVFAKALSDIISSETDRFLVKVLEHLIPPEPESAADSE